MPSAWFGHRYRHLFAFATAVLCALSVAKGFQNFPAIHDVVLWDETLYLRFGLDRTVALPGPYEQGGLYSLMYRALGVFIADPIDVYMAGGLIVILAMLALMFLALLVLSGSPALAAAGMSFFVISGATQVWPRVTFAAIAGLALWLSLAHHRPLVVKLAAAALAAFLMSFIRPEFALSFILLAAAAVTALAWRGLAALRRGAPGGTAGLPAAALLLGVLAVLGLAWSVPWPHGDGRAFYAFAQHYAYRIVTTQGLAIDPWIEWQGFVEAAFPGATTVSEAARINPAAFAGVLLSNLAGIAAGMRDMGLAFLAGGLAGGGLAERAAMAVFLAATAAVPVVAAVAGWRQRPSWRRGLGTASILLAFAAPVVLSMVLIYPRQHYLIQGLFILMALVALPVGAALGGTGRGAWLGPLVGGAALVLTPVLPVVPQPTIETIHALRRVGPIRAMAELDGGWCTYLRPPCRFVGLEHPIDRPFEVFLAEQGVDAVMASPRLLAVPRFARDPWLGRALADPAAAGFEPYALPHGHTLLKARDPAAPPVAASPAAP